MKNKTNASVSLRKLLLSALVAAPLATLPTPLWALPANQSDLNSQIANKSSGVTVTSTSSTQVDVTSTSQYSVINWNNFGGADAAHNNIIAGDTVNFALPSSTSSILNRVTGTTGTTVNGTLSSNGSVWILNPNGVTIGATGVINAAGVGLSTVPETEYAFLTTGALAGVENQGDGITTTTGVSVLSGAKLTAASGSGNVWISGNGIALAGTIDAGNVTVAGVRTGVVSLGDAGDLTVGNATLRNASMNVTTAASQIDVSNDVVVLGSTLSLTTGGNAIINQTAGSVLAIGDSLAGNATLTTSTGTGAQTFVDVQAYGSGLLTVGATGGAMSITSGAGRIAVGAVSSGALTVTSTGDLTLNAGNVSALTATSSSGSILSGGQIDVRGGAVSLTTIAGKDVAISVKAAPSSVTLAGVTFGSVSYTQATGDIVIPAITAGNVTFTATAGNISFGGVQTVATLATYKGKDVAIGSAINTGNLTVTASGNITQTAAINAAAAGVGNVSLVSTGGLINLTSTIGAGTAPSLVKVDANKGVTLGGAIIATNINAKAGTDLSVAAALNSTAAGTGDISLTSTSGSITSTAAGIIGGATPAANITITSGKLIDIGAAITATKVTATAATTYNQAAAISTSGDTSITATGNATLAAGGTITSTAGNVSLSGAYVNQGAAISANKDATLTATGNLAVAAAVTATTGNVSASGAYLNQTAAISASKTANLTATGNIVVGSTIGATDLNASGAYISGAGVITSSGNATFSSTSSINLTGSSDFATLVVKETPGTATFTDANAVILGDGTAATGNVTITAGSVALGNTAAGTVSVDKKLDLTVSAGATAVTDATNNAKVGGNLTITSTGAAVVTLDGATGNAVGLNSSYGAVKITTVGGAAKVFEAQTLNLGTINLGGADLTAYSATGIVNSGVITAVNVKVGAGTATNPGDIALDFKDGNAITGTVSLYDDLGLLGSTLVGNYLAKNLTIVNNAASASLVSIGTADTNAKVNVNLTTLGTNALNFTALNTTGSVTLTSGTGAITGGSSKYTSVTVNAGGAVNLTTAGALTVNGNISGTGAVTYTSSGGNLTIGQYVSTSTGVTTFAGANAVIDSSAGISIFGDTTFTGKSLSITNAGHNFGQVSITTTAGGASIVEAGTLRLKAASVTGGNLVATSTYGDVIQSGVITANKDATFKASNGAVTLDTSANVITGNVSLTALNTSKFRNTLATKLGAVTVAAGGLTVDLSGTAGIALTQKTGTAIYTYGATTLKTNAAAITLTNSGNQFGGLTLASNGGDIAVTELTTLNLAAVTTGAGNLTVTSEGGDIIDTGVVTVGGVASFAATIGSITLDKVGSDYAVVKLSAAGDAQIIDSIGNLQLDTSSVTGALYVENTLGNISQLGALTIGGNSTFIASAAGSSLILNNTANAFGAFRFTAGTGGTLINEATSFNLRAGSISTGAVTINTGGDFLTSGTGGSSITNNLTINATGTIIPGAGSLLVTGTFTVKSDSLKDLSALNKSGNLAGKDPVNQGTGEYKAPTQDL
ncbi:filamentous hemagglutinin N-terminal domain-containing protein [Opitutus sp. ER46]|uniref:beta strand repeat-containing protein n=1 Tax=Opitutus sp. ER46 TaxID=2161864 RepID=UPI000D3013DE|nr:filamentous hemagglutinin N-terminal domain-containing protein [Opitutus sp. ER46]PTX92609.1 hypothetical protein DB354_14885 [Opitutus sp. ER46]